MILNIVKGILVLTLVFSYHFSGQSQVFEKGDVLIDGYYGFPNLFGRIAKEGHKLLPDKFTDLRTSSIGPFGGRVEYLILPQLGVGLNVNYAKTTLDGTLLKPGNRNDSAFIQRLEYSIDITRLRIMPVITWHIGNSENFDPYLSLCIGYNSAKIKPRLNAINEIPSFGIPLGMPFRIEGGFRYFFIEQVGFNFQLGAFGGPLIAIGLSARI